MVKLEDIVEAYFHARGKKRKSPDAVEFRLHWEAGCVRLWDEVNTKSVRSTAYTFVAKHPSPREVFACDFATRILHHYLDIRLRPLLEKRRTDHTYNNRIGKGATACQNAVREDIWRVSGGYNRDAWIIKTDLSGCFPNISQDIAYGQLREVIESDYNGEDKDDLLYILQVCIYSYPTMHCRRKSPLSDWVKIPPEKSLFKKPDGIGAAIGHLIWQQAETFYFNSIAKWLESIGIAFEWYVDDIYFVTDNKEAFLAYVLPELRKQFAELGAELHPRKFYCQHYTKGVECLGQHIMPGRTHPNERIMRNALKKIQKFARCPRRGKVEAFLSSFNSYLGVCKQAGSWKAAERLADAIPKAWREFVCYDRENAVAKPLRGFSADEIIIRRYNLN